MVAKKNNNVVIDLTVARNTLKAFNKEIKAQREYIESEYKAIQKKEDALWKLEDQARSLDKVIKLGSTLKSIAA